jgi:Nucleotidyl transferase AbiEii toxin, Type IV TA system
MAPGDTNVGSRPTWLVATFAPRLGDKINVHAIPGGEPRTAGLPPRPALRRLRESITGELLKAGFAFDPKNPEHLKFNYESRYTLYRLPYEPVAAGQGTLRPEITIETSVWPARRPPIERPVISFVAEAFKRPPEVPAIACAAIVETAAENFVALTVIFLSRARGTW